MKLVWKKDLLLQQKKWRQQCFMGGNTDIISLMYVEELVSAMHIMPSKQEAIVKC